MIESSLQGRKELVQNLLAGNDNTLCDAEHDLIVTLTEGYNGSDLRDACKGAVLGPIRELLASGNFHDTSVKVNFMS